MKLHLQSLCALAVASVLATQAQGAPTVSQASGTFSNGNSVTITGSGFGTKSTAAPLVYDNFEGGSNGSKVMTNNAVVGKWEDGAGHDQPVYTTELAYAGSKSVRLSARSNGAYNLSVNQNGSFPVIYMDWWVRVNQLSGVSRNWKPWRIYGNADTMTANAVIMCNGSGLSVINESAEAGFWWEGGDFNNGQWQHYQVALRASSSGGAADGAVMQYINGRLISNHTGVVTRRGSAHWDQIRIGHYWAMDGVAECGANSGADLFLDNVYIDTSWARVELGNANTYSGSTKREIQVPTAWSASSVTVNVSTGTFASGSTAYLYVVDSSGAVNSNGIAVTIGAGSKAPSPPTNVTAN
ncbi:hypothetical protein HNQ60_000487 [Povalibacter uvarum]|uniref:IPT/TIG domain-containing protein n=1 Tax=Povalibacter uvarum TaxID=732238 RepID=A0A841HEU9_9GAMM|nr:hypothetical protein [Povalibacter uvarum]MBB6091641.1 hypothetical protein [Povalibacter uvarum]